MAQKPDPEPPRRPAIRRHVLQNTSRWPVLGLLIVVGAATPVAWGGPPTQADDRARIEFSAGAAQILDEGEHSWNGGISYVWQPMGRWGISPAIGFMRAEHTANSVFAEIHKDFWLGRQWVVTPKFAAGRYHESDGLGLGNELMFREGVVLSWVGQRLRLGLGFYHASNAGLGDKNPGTEVLEVVFGVPLGTKSK